MTRRDTKQQINHLLSYIGNEGFSGVTAEARSLHQALIILHAYPPETPLDKQKSLAHELRRQNLVEISHNDGAMRIQLSVKGLYRLQQAVITSITIPTPPTWDGRWRIVMFDIPARKAESRYQLTSQLRRLDFQLLQSSVWAYPYPCFTELQSIISHAQLTPFVTLAEVSRLDPVSERRLLRHFPELRK